MKQQKPLLFRTLHLAHAALLFGMTFGIVVFSLFAYLNSSVWLQPTQAGGTAIFSQNSFWNTQIPKYAPTHPNSNNFVTEIQRQIDAYYGNAEIRTTSGSAPVYVVDANTPTVVVTQWDCQSAGSISSGLASQWQAVPIPSYAEPAAGSDAEMVIYQPSTQTVWEFWRARKVGGSWEACWGGRVQSTGSSSGIFPSPYGSTSTGLAVLGGQLGINEMKTGTINHVIGLSLVDLETFTNYSWPANRSDGYNPTNAPNRIPEGLRFRLDPSVNVDSLGLHPVARMVAKAAQDYGFVVWEKSGTVGLRGEDPKSYTLRGLTDPYGSLFGGTSGTNVLNNFPWDKLQALPANYGQTGIAPTITNFSASKSTVNAGDQVTFSWNATNIDSCSIPGVAKSLAASGSMQSPALNISTTFSLVCGGVAGSASQRKVITVNSLNTTASSTSALPPGEIAQAPVSGLVAIIPELSTLEAAETIYKVEYYENGLLVDAVTQAPFSLDSTLLDDGEHVLGVKMYYRDGHTEEKSANINVINQEDLLTFASNAAPTRPEYLKMAYSVTGGFLSVIVMAFAIRYGLRLSRLS
jgi:hypothetical protein